MKEGRQPILQGVTRRDILRGSGIAAVASLTGFGTVYEAAKSGMLLKKSDFTQSIDTKMLPETLPSPVDAMQYAVVKINTNVRGFSGVMISPAHILTVGHGVREDNNTLIPARFCPDILTISGRSPEGKVVKKTATKITSSLKKDNSLPDLAIIELATPLYDLPIARLRKEPLSPSKEELFLASYQDDNNGNFRAPDNKDATHRSIVIFGGISVGKATRSIEVRVGLKNYGPQPDMHLNPAGSGGAVFDKEGFLVALSVATPIDQPNKGVFIEPINEALITNYLNKLDHPDDCVT